jgi:protein gp37
MAENTKIEWAHHTFNPWIGCTKVSPACKNCYAERDFDHRLRQVQWGPNGTRVLTTVSNWRKPLKWNRDVEKEYEVAQAQWVADCCEGTKSYPEPELQQFRKRVFCASLADVFEDWQGPIVNSKGERGVVTCADSVWFTNGPVSNCRDLTMDDVRTQLFALIDATPNLDWLLLTKRPENISTMLFDPDSLNGWKVRSNVWLGTSVENQEYADNRIPELLKCRDLSPVLFLSCEPLLGPVDLPGDVHCPYCEEGFPDKETGLIECSTCDGSGVRNDQLNFDFDWVIAGGESGPEARPTDPEWFRSLRDQCQAAGVPFLFKQWGEFGPVAAATPSQLCKATFASYKRGERLYRIGKAQAGRLLDGVTHDGFPNE